MAYLYDLQEQKKPDESKADFKERTKDIKHPIIEKMFREYAPKYNKRKAELGQGGGYTRILKMGPRKATARDGRPRADLSQSLCSKKRTSPTGGRPFFCTPEEGWRGSGRAGSLLGGKVVEDGLALLLGLAELHHQVVEEPRGAGDGGVRAVDHPAVARLVAAFGGRGRPGQ